MSDESVRVVVIGGGFGGLEAAKQLRDSAVKVTVCDRDNYHLFQPLLYQVATGGLAPGEIAVPIRRILRGQGNAEVLLQDIEAVDLDRREVVHATGRIPYDYLVVASGARHNYFGHEAWQSAAPGLKTLEEALDIRRRIYLAYDEARDWDPNDPRLSALAERTVQWTTTHHDVVVGSRLDTPPNEPNVMLVAQLMDAESAYTSPALNRLAELCREQLKTSSRPGRHHGKHSK
jgi:NADH dehydrogenase FAD-containing subunit